MLMKESVGEGCLRDSLSFVQWLAKFDSEDMKVTVRNPNFLEGLKTFCQVTDEKDLADLGMKAVQAGMEHAVDLTDACNSLRAETLPKLWGMLTAAFEATLIHSCSMFDASWQCLPTTQDYSWRALAAVSDNIEAVYASLHPVAKVLDKIQELKDLEGEYMKGAFMHKACLAMSTIFESSLDPDTTVPTIQVEGFSRILGAMKALTDAYGDLTSKKAILGDGEQVCNAARGWMKEFAMAQLFQVVTLAQSCAACFTEARLRGSPGF